MVSFHQAEAGIFEVAILLITLISIIGYIVLSKPKKSQNYRNSSNNDVDMWD